MTSSLVGSEMCIRDSINCSQTLAHKVPKEAELWGCQVHDILLDPRQKVQLLFHRRILGTVTKSSA
eukprot:7142450-Prorocentrum_lima.AAC.1